MCFIIIISVLHVSEKKILINIVLVIQAILAKTIFAR